MAVRRRNAALLSSLGQVLELVVGEKLGQNWQLCLLFSVTQYQLKSVINDNIVLFDFLALPTRGVVGCTDSNHV